MKARIISLFVFGVMLNLGIIAQESANPDSLAIGASMGERGGAISAGIDLTTPYLVLFGKLQGALRLGGDIQMLEGILVSGSGNATMESYFSIRLGIVVAASIIANIRVYDELGGIAVFPSSAMSSSTDPGFGFYSHIGTEFFISSRGGFFFEIGDVFNTGGAADKFEGSPFIDNGLTACAGVRLYL